MIYLEDRFLLSAPRISEFSDGKISGISWLDGDSWKNTNLVKNKDGLYTIPDNCQFVCGPMALKTEVSENFEGWRFLGVLIPSVIMSAVTASSFWALNNNPKMVINFSLGGAILNMVDKNWIESDSTLDWGEKCLVAVKGLGVGFLAAGVANLARTPEDFFYNLSESKVIEFIVLGMIETLWLAHELFPDSRKPDTCVVKC
jgi:hypothetical protein